MTRWIAAAIVLAEAHVIPIIVLHATTLLQSFQKDTFNGTLAAAGAGIVTWSCMRMLTTTLLAVVECERKQ